LPAGEACHRLRLDLSAHPAACESREVCSDRSKRLR
jgi:hypothetical protein